MKKQLELNLDKGRHGGRRKGSGRKRIHSKGVAHRKREKVSPRTPLHINVKVRAYIKSKECLKLLKRAILNSRKKGLRIIHYSLQTNHIHLIVEAADNAILSSGMRSFTVTFNRGLNRGKVQLERYHLHVLKHLQAVKNAVHYVLLNEIHHSKKRSLHVDEHSSLIFQDKEFLKRLLRGISRTTDTITAAGLLDSPSSWLLLQTS